MLIFGARALASFGSKKKMGEREGEREEVCLLSVQP
jgi:hypothetical protein